ncbi:hypothetical protein MASR2M15_05620 [Anaerolineales bacterium]
MNRSINLLQTPLLGRLLRWKWGRVAIQTPLLIIAILLIIDGFTGPQIASRNLATVLPWVHYRGIIVIVLLLGGNLFCMACPFTLSRSLGKRLSIRGRRFPARLRNKWLAIFTLLTLFFLYEWLDLWASPLLTAWVIIAYFVASFLFEAIFTESAFCKYVCPLGSFNYVYSNLAPTRITVGDLDICRQCPGKECINGSYQNTPLISTLDIPVQSSLPPRKPSLEVLGCGTELFAPQMTSNMDCTLCLDCVRACPYDNVIWKLGSFGQGLAKDAWRKGWDQSLLVIILSFLGLMNAFGMVPPVFDLQRDLGALLHTQDEFIPLLLIFLFIVVIAPFSLSIAAAYLTRIFSKTHRNQRLRDIVALFAPAFVPIGLGIWIAHYSFHFLIVPLSFIPVFQEFLGMSGNWQTFNVAADINFIGLVQMIAIAGGCLWSLKRIQSIAFSEYKKEALPITFAWSMIILVLVLAALQIFALPMEMRGSDNMFASLFTLGQGF